MPSSAIPWAGKLLSSFYSKPLHYLTEKNVSFKWTTQCQTAFDTLCEQLSSPPVLVFPDFSKSFILDTDASAVGLGAVLSQVQDDGAEDIVAYASRVLTKAERQYSVTRRELLAVIIFLDHFRQYLLGKPFLLRSDHGSLQGLQNFKNPEGQLACWLEKLQEYTFTIQHRPGTKHLNADTLSRLPEGDSGALTDLGLISGVLREISNEQLRSLQHQDTELKPVMFAKEQDVCPTKEEVRCQSLKTRKLIQIWDQLTLHEGLLMRRFRDANTDSTRLQLVVPRCLRESILEELHRGIVGGHLGEEKTLGRLKQRFYWPGHYRDVHQWCQTCASCATRKTAAPLFKAPLGNMTVGSPMQFVSVDIVGPFPEGLQGNKYILVAVDEFTKWSEAFPIPNQEASTVASVLSQEWFFRYSPPEIQHSD